jgi:glycerol-3-phosphate dehydrogenase (NAD(P)+)
MAAADTLGLVGAGRFGTALGQVVAEAGRDVLVWSTNSAVVQKINEDHACPGRQPRVPLSRRFRATTDPQELAESARFIVFAVVPAAVGPRARILGDALNGRHLLVHASGALSSWGDQPVSKVLLAETPARRVGVLAGPVLPNDLVSRQFASMVVASEFDEVAAEGRRLLSVPPALRVYQGRDLVGAELAAALSSAYTVALGAADALNIGPGPRAGMITRALAEASRLGEALGAQRSTFAGLAGLGNLLVRSSPGTHARDYLLGLELGRRGCIPGDRVTEGVHAAAAGERLARQHGVRVPILAALNAMIAGQLAPQRAGAALAESVAADEL